MWNAFGKRTNIRRIREPLEKTPQLALGFKQRKNTRGYVAEKKEMTSWSSDRL